jgi:hypothetical protein
LVGSLDETVAYMNMWSLVHGLNYELIIVDDGSKDRTAEIVHEYMKNQKETMTLLQLHLNSGKVAALKVGVQEARGSYVLIVSTRIHTRSNEERIITSSTDHTMFLIHYSTARCRWCDPDRGCRESA